MAANCPICHDVLVSPRIFDACGHSLCELCSLQNDMVAIDDAGLNALPMFRCPVCRSGSLLPTMERPLNHSLQQLLQEQPPPGYATRVAQARKDREEWLLDVDVDMEMLRSLVEPMPVNVDGGKEGGGEEPPNLAAVASGVRHRKANVLFQRILPQLLKAAKRGASRLIINTRARELAEVSRELAVLLFPYGIHSVTAHVREFSVNILREEGRHSWSGAGEFINDAYSDPPPPQVPEVVSSQVQEEDNAAPTSRSSDDEDAF